MRCKVCHEPIVQGPRPVDWAHEHGDIYCGTGDGAMATPDVDDRLCREAGDHVAATRHLRDECSLTTDNWVERVKAVEQGRRPTDLVIKLTGPGSVTSPHPLGGVPGVVPLPGDQPNEPIVPIGQTEDETPEPEEAPVFYTYADLSTGHLPQEEFESITAAPARVIEHEYGAFVNVLIFESLHDGGDWDGFPALRKVLEWARQRNVRWVNFDQDGDVTEELPTWEW